jgi:PAS domain S-box-containing protein
MSVPSKVPRFGESIKGGWLLLLLSLSTALYATEAVRVGVLAFRPVPETLERWQPTIDHLNANSLDRHFHLEALSYEALNKKAAEGKLDFILTNPSHYILLMHRHDTSRVATMLATESGMSVAGFGGVVAVRSDRADLRTLTDLRGKQVAAPSLESLGGYQLQAVLMMQKGLNPDRDLKMRFTDMPHDRAIAAVLEGEVDGAFIRTGVIEALIHEGRLESDQLRILNPQKRTDFPFMLSTRLVPEWPFAVMPHVGPAVARDVAISLLSVGQNSPAAQAGGYVGWTIPGDYEPVRQILEKLRMPPYDEAQPIIWRDLLSQYGIALVAIGVLFVLVVALLLLATLAHRRLKAKNQTIEAIAVSMAEGLYVINTKGEVTFVNPAALKLLGYTEGEMMGRVAHDLFHRHDDNNHLPLAQCPIFATIQSGQAYHGIERFERKDGRRFEARVASSPLSRNGRVVGSVAVFEDVTEEIRTKRQIEYFNEELRKEVEQEVALRLKSETEKQHQTAVLIQQSKLAELGSMIGAIAHQWKQPVNAVGLIAQGLVDSYDYGELNRKELVRSVENIMDQATFMAHTIDDFRNFYKPSRTLEPFDVKAACVQVVDLLSLQMMKHQIVPAITGTGPLIALGYPSEFKQVVLNILNNAKEALTAHDIQKPTITLKLSSDHQTVQIAIADNGGGIPAELLPEKIFSPFVSTKGKEGTGIGLSLAKTIIEEKMHGTLKAQNRDSGACFIITLPRKETEGDVS